MRFGIRQCGCGCPDCVGLHYSGREPTAQEQQFGWASTPTLGLSALVSSGAYGPNALHRPSTGTLISRAAVSHRSASIGVRRAEVSWESRKLGLYASTLPAEGQLEDFRLGYSDSAVGNTREFVALHAGLVVTMQRRATDKSWADVPWGSTVNAGEQIRFVVTGACQACNGFLRPDCTRFQVFSGSDQSESAKLQDERGSGNDPEYFYFTPIGSQDYNVLVDAAEDCVTIGGRSTATGNFSSLGQQFGPPGPGPTPQPGPTPTPQPQPQPPGSDCGFLGLGCLFGGGSGGFFGQIGSILALGIAGIVLINVTKK